MTYEIVTSEDGKQKGIKCLDCGLTSWHYQDITEKYCGNCHEFHETKANRNSTPMKRIQFQVLLEIIKEHRKHCNSECNIALYTMKPVAENLIGRKLTEEEFRLFI